MQRAFRFLFVTITAIYLSLGHLFAQSQTTNNHTNFPWFGGVQGGASLFWGDLKMNTFWPSLSQGELKPEFGLQFGRTFSSSFRVSSELNYFSLSGKKQLSIDTLAFNSKAISFALKGHFNPIELIRHQHSKFNLFLEAGVGFQSWKNLLYNQTTGDTLVNNGFDNKNRLYGMIFPVGLRIEYQIVPNISAYFSTSYHFTLSDMLDGGQRGGSDAYSFTGVGINYHFGKQKETPKLLPYPYFEVKFDDTPLIEETEYQELKPEAEEAQNPFQVELFIPENSPHTGLDIKISIKKLGISATGFFRLLVPSGFIPQQAPNPEVSFTKLGHRYEYDFILPMNQDSITIPISIKLSEIEKGTYPILVEGEIADQKGKTYPIKFAKYANIISEDEWYQGLPKKEKDKIDQDKALQKEISNQTTAEKSKVFNKESNTKSAAKEPEKAHLNPELDSTKIYRIQIMASRTMLSNLDDYKNAHQIKEALFISQADGWFRYNIYASSDLVEAEKLLTQVRNQHQIKDAFIVLYEHGVRKSIASHTKPKGTYTNNQTSNLHSATANNTPKAISSETFYRIEIAMAYEKPIPLYLLQSKVANEEITEFNIDSKFYYTIGKFEEANVAKAYLNYVVNQFKLENAQIVQYKGNTRLRAIQ